MSTEQNGDYDVIVVGAGLPVSRVNKLRGLGYSVKVFEAGDGVGGTWFWNRYPGHAAMSRAWSILFLRSRTGTGMDWPDKYGKQSDILKYVNHVAERST